MLQAVEVVQTGRAQERRAVSVSCEVFAPDWEQPLPLIAGDLSKDGMWIRCPFPVAPGTELLVSFSPPRWRWEPLMCLAEVCWWQPRFRTGDRRGTGMGIRFVDLPEFDREAVQRCLRGLPPPLPQRNRPVQEMVWVDALLTWEEDLGDRLNIFEVSEYVLVDIAKDGEIEFEALSEPLGETLRLTG